MERFFSVKSKVEDELEMESRLFELTESLGTQFDQIDVYFECLRGTLKVRRMPPSPEGEVISTNVVEGEDGMRLIENTRSIIDDVDSLKETLAATLGEIGTVVKSRRVFTLPDARIYLDEVKGIGSFIELLVAVSPMDKEAEDKARLRTQDLARELSIAKDQRLALSYIQLISPLQRHPQRS